MAMMKIDLIRIGNSRGIRIPKPIIDQCGLGDTVQLHVEQDRVVITPDRAPRQGWELAFKSAGDAVEDDLLLDDVNNEFDNQEWTW